MPRIFISYRRKDSEAITGRIYDRLVTAFGEDNIFQDVENIPPGVDFRAFLSEQIAICDVVLVIIGQNWSSIKDERGQQRLANPADFVRIEVENALNQSKYVVPVLVDGAKMPYASDLPVVMQDLCFRNAATVRHNPDFHRDVNKLINGINWWSSSIQLMMNSKVNSLSTDENIVNTTEGYDDEMYEEAVEMVRLLGKASISLIQRRLRIGYTRAARIIDTMEERGIVGPAKEGSKPRDVLK